MNKKIILFILLLVIIFGLAAISFILFRNNREDVALTETVVEEIKADYSEISKIKPEKSTVEDVKKIVGSPKSEQKSGNKTLLQYATPIANLDNTVAIENDKVVYVIEKVYGDYKGTYPEFKSRNGEPDLILFRDGYPWSVYLEEGVAIEHDSRDIGTMLYFAPMSKDEFMNSLAKELFLLLSPPDYH
jgi:hypothetical protein